MRPHQKLNAWKTSFQFATQVYTITKEFPTEEKFGLISQIRRAAVSVPVNIAEGAARKSKKEFTHFLHISLGSASELDTLLLLSKELNYIDQENFSKLNQQLEEISKILSGLIRYTSTTN